MKKSYSSLLAIALLSLSMFRHSPAQHSIQKIPSFFTDVGSAALYQGKNSFYVVAYAETSGYVPVPEVWFSRGFVYALQSDSAGNFIRPLIIDTLYSNSYGLWGMFDDCAFDAVENSIGVFVVALNHRNVEWTDVWPIIIPRRAELRCRRIYDGISYQFFSETNADNGRVAADTLGNVHLVYESLTNLDTVAYPTLLRVRSKVLHRILPPEKSVSGEFLDPDTIGKGFSPEVAVDSHGTLYVVWIDCDSTAALAGALTLARLSGGIVTKIQLHTVSLESAREYSTVWHLPEVHLAVDDARTAWISWAEKYRDTTLFIARIGSDDHITIDSLPLRSTELLDHALAVDRNGTAHLVWNAGIRGSGEYSLFAASSDEGKKLFRSATRLTTSTWYGFPHLVKNSRGEVRCAYNGSSGITYVRNLSETRPGLTIVGGSSLATVSLRRDNFGFSVLKKSAIIDKKNKLHVAFNNPYNGDSSKIGLSLLSADESILAVRANVRQGVNNFSLYQNYPNPFNPGTNIRFRLRASGFTSLKIFDILGREVATLVNEEMKPGDYKLTWDAATFPSGIYFYRLTAGGFVETRKMTVLR